MLVFLLWNKPLLEFICNNSLTTSALAKAVTITCIEMMLSVLVLFFSFKYDKIIVLKLSKYGKHDVC